MPKGHQVLLLVLIQSPAPLWLNEAPLWLCPPASPHVGASPIFAPPLFLILLPSHCFLISILLFLCFPLPTTPPFALNSHTPPPCSLTAPHHVCSHLCPRSQPLLPPCPVPAPLHLLWNESILSSALSAPWHHIYQLVPSKPWGVLTPNGEDDDRRPNILVLTIRF